MIYAYQYQKGSDPAQLQAELYSTLSALQPYWVEYGPWGTRVNLFSTLDASTLQAMDAIVEAHDPDAFRTVIAR